jgi:NADH:ubiquinone oxidoreductase subunit E
MSQCACGNDNKFTLEQIQAEVDRIVARVGTGPEAAIPILQEIQAVFRFLPREALERVCALTGITPAQLTGVSTFYSQFRHKGLGKHLIQVCHGTACHVAGAEQITDSIRRQLKIEGGEDTSPDGEFTVERVACLGCCTLAPVMLIDGITYGHLTPASANEAVERFLREEAEGLHERQRQQQDLTGAKSNGNAQAEIRIGLNSCCIASGSLGVRDALSKAVANSGAEVNIKPVGCIGMCHRVPIVEVVSPEGRSTLYGDNTPRSAAAIVKRRIKPQGFWRKTRHAVEATLELLGGDDGQRLETRRIDPASGAGGEFLAGQVRIATVNAGEIAPLDLDEYLKFDGYVALRKAVTELKPEEVIEVVEHPEPDAPGAGEALVQTEFFPINPADVLNLEGKYGATAPILPMIPGAEGVGRVTQVGAGVAHLKPGDRVLLPGPGAWRERAVGKAAGMFALPAGVDPKQLAMLRVNPPTAYLMLHIHIRI